MNTSPCKSALELCGNLCDQKYIKELGTTISMIKKQAKSVACLVLSEKLEQLKSGDYQLRRPVTLLANRIENDVKNGVIKIACPRSAIESEEKILFGKEEPFGSEPAPGYGTAFFIGGEYALTAGHCVCRATHSSDPCLKTSDCESEYIKKTLLIFDFKMEEVNRCKDTFPASDVYKVEKVVRHKFIKIMDKNDDLYTKWVDWAIIKLTKKVEGREPLAIDYFHGVAKNVHLYMLGHPSGLPVKLIKGGVVKKNDHSGYFECSLNAFSGNSGSPVFNLSTGKVVGIFSGGGEDYKATRNYKGTGRTCLEACDKKESEKCQRMDSLLVEVDRCNILKSRSVSKVEQEDFIQSLKDSYTSQKNIPRLLRKKPVPIDIYAQLVLLQKEIKKPDGAIQEDEKEKYIRGLHRISWEEIQGSKKAIDLDKLFDRLPDQTQAPKQLLIIGKAGVGKSTLCHHIACQWAGGLWKDKFDAVFWVQLRKLQDISPNETVSSFLFRSCCRKTCTLYPPEVMNYIKKNNERILFLLDGYDEVDLTNQAQKEIVDKLLKNSCWILTSRPYAAQDIKADATIENIGFTPESIKSYISRLFLHDTNRAEDTFQGIFQNPLIFDLCHVPINLEIVSTILEKHVDAQKNVFTIHSMSHLYQVLTRTFQRCFLERMGMDEKKCWEMEDSQLEQELRLNKYSSVFEFLESAAWGSLKKNQFLLSFDKEDLQAFYCTHGFKTTEEQEKFCENIYLSGLLRSYKRSSALYQSQHSFPHLTFQEFFSARYLVRLLQSEKRQSVNEAIQSIKDIKFNPRYKIVIWFMAGLLKDDAKNLNLFFDLLDDPKDVIGLYSTLLKVRCLEECEWTDKLNKIKEYEEEVRWWCSQVMHPTFWWSIDRFMSEIFEISPASAEKVLSPILISLFKEKKMNYGYYTGRTGLLANPKEILPLIKGCLENNQIVEYHLSELFGRIGQMDIQSSLPLIKELLKNKERVVRQNAVKALSQLGPTHLQLVLPLLLDTLRDENKFIRAQAVEALTPLGKAAPTIIYPQLKKALESEKRYVKAEIIRALSLAEQIEFRPSISILTQAVTDKNIGLREEAIQASGYVDSKSAFELIKKAISGYVSMQHNLERQHIPFAIRRVWRADPNPFIDLLLTSLFNDHSVYARRKAAIVLGEIGKEEPELAQPLVECLKSALMYDQDPYVGESAAIGLGIVAQAAPQIVIPYLEQVLLTDQREVVRCGAAIGLGYAGKDHALTVLPILQQAFDDERYVKDGVARALSMMPRGTNLQFAISFLKTSLEKSTEGMKLFASAIAASRLVDWSSDVEYIKYFIVGLADGDRNERFLPCTPLGSLIQNYGQQPINHSDYLLAIAVKCIKENTVIFLKDNHLCYYEKGEILPIEVPDAEARAFKIQQTIKNLSKQIEEIKERK